MVRNLLAIMIDHRKENSVNVQKTLTAWGCLIKTRLGLHDDVLDGCSSSGLIILELVGDTEKHAELQRKLNLLSGVKAEYLSLNLSE